MKKKLYKNKILSLIHLNKKRKKNKIDHQLTKTLTHNMIISISRP